MRARAFLFAIMLAAQSPCFMAQEPATADVQVVLRSQADRKQMAAVVWLSPASGTLVPRFVPHGEYILVQKNRTFEPHMQVVPIGAVVEFPNRDPFFHNVFSLFDGKRFDLGLYEAGSTKAVTFAREGISYIFCNIHPEMSAVVITLASPFYALGRTGEKLTIHNVTAGDYEVRVWIEGAQAETVKGSPRRVHVHPGTLDLGEIVVDAGGSAQAHTDKFGRPYLRETRPTY